MRVCIVYVYMNTYVTHTHTLVQHAHAGWNRALLRHGRHTGHLELDFVGGLLHGALVWCG
jgi:hypothetical protein